MGLGEMQYIFLVKLAFLKSNEKTHKTSKMFRRDKRLFLNYGK